VIEAGELRPESRCASACERAKTAVAIACYADDAGQLARLIDSELRGLEFEHRRRRRAVLMSCSAATAQARARTERSSRSTPWRARVTLDDVMAVVADASELKVDPIVDGRVRRKAGSVETEFAKAMVAGTYPDDHLGRAAPCRLAAQDQPRGGRGNAGIDLARQRISAAAFFPKAERRNRAAEFQLGATARRHRQLATAALEMRKHRRWRP